jgi:hypothetical protein
MASARAVLALSALAAFVGCTSPSSDGRGDLGCTRIGCASGARMSISVDAPEDRLRGFSLEVCRNDVCGRAWPKDLPTTTGVGTVAAIRGRLSGSLTLRTTSTGFRVDLEVGAGTTSSSFSDGDHYTVTVTTADGAVAGTFDRVASYVDARPNGEDCDAIPCRQATLAAASIRIL